MRVLLACIALATLAACADESAQSAEQEASDVASDQFGGLDVNGIANCVRDNATPAELTVLGAGGQISQQMTNIILQRESTATCLADNNIVLPGAPG